MNTQRRDVAIVGVVIIGLVVGAWTLISVATAPSTAGADQRACWAGDNKIEADFTIATGAELWEVLPNLGKAPYVERDARPFRVVVFEDGFRLRLPNVAGDSAERIYDGVVCVIDADGQGRLFADVSRDGRQFPVGP